MAQNPNISDLVELSVPERILAVQDLWDSIVFFPDSVSLTDEQKRELDERLEAYHKNPEVVTPWEEIRLKFKGNS